ncbi:MAG: hypothetical protein ACOYL6_04010 [Bacteriovoracaceae bacterium]
MKISKSMVGLSLLGVGFLALATYSNLSINSDDFMNDNEIRFVKNMNGLTGTTVRAVASLKPLNLFGDEHKDKKTKAHPFRGFVNKMGKAITNRVAALKTDPNCAPAVIGGELDLNLSELYSPNPKLAGVSKEKLNGSLSANNGVIDSMDVILPNGESIALNSIRMCGNLFTVEISSEKYTGMIFTTDNKSYMVSLTSTSSTTSNEVSLNGMRMKFEANQAVDETPAQDVADVEVEQAPAMAPVAQPGFIAPQGQPVQYNANNYDQEPQMNPAPQMVQNQFVQQPVNGEAYNNEEIEGQVQNNGFNFAPPAAEAQM